MYSVIFSVHDIGKRTELSPSEVLEMAWDLAWDEVEKETCLFSTSKNDSNITNCIIYDGQLEKDGTYKYHAAVVANECTDESEQVRKSFEIWLKSLVGIDIEDYEIESVKFDKRSEMPDDCIFGEEYMPL